MLWHDTLQVHLGPDRVGYRIYPPFGRSASLAGNLECPSVYGLRPWSAACEALRTFLDEERPRRMRIEVVLSDRFTHYQILPWRDGLTRRAEWRAYAQHSFESVYGDTARNWRVRIEVVPPGRESLACAVETDLIDMLRDIVHEGFSRLVSVRPSFIVNFGQRRTALRGKQFWFAVVEQHHACLGAFRNGRWIALRNEAAPDGWRETLPGMLQRTQCILEQPCDGELYLCGDVSAGETLAGIGSDRIHLLTVRPQFESSAEARPAP